jgi:hypothetical protein
MLVICFTRNVLYEIPIFSILDWLFLDASIKASNKYNSITVMHLVSGVSPML